MDFLFSIVVKVVDILAEPLSRTGLPLAKARHIVAGLLLSLIGLWAGPLYGGTVTLAAAVLRELQARAAGGKPDVWDGVATVAGGSPITGALVYLG